MARPKISKEMKIKELEKQLEDTKKLLNEAERRNQDLINERRSLKFENETNEYLELRSQLATLQGKIEGLKTFLKDREAEIYRLQTVIAGMDQQQSDTVSQVDVIEQRIIEKENEKVVHPGRPKKITPEMIEAMLALHDKGYSVRKIAEGMNVSVGTVHRYLQM